MPPQRRPAALGHPRSATPPTPPLSPQVHSLRSKAAAAAADLRERLQGALHERDQKAARLEASEEKLAELVGGRRAEREQLKRKARLLDGRLRGAGAAANKGLDAALDAALAAFAGGGEVIRRVGKNEDRAGGAGDSGGWAADDVQEMVAAAEQEAGGLRRAAERAEARLERWRRLKALAGEGDGDGGGPAAGAGEELKRK